MNYSKIYNPKTGRFVKIDGKLGRQILKNYLQYIGGASQGPPPPSQKKPAFSDFVHTFPDFEVGKEVKPPTPRDFALGTLGINPKVPAAQLRGIFSDSKSATGVLATITKDKTRRYPAVNQQALYNFKPYEATYIICAHGKILPYVEAIDPAYFPNYSYGVLVNEGEILSAYCGKNLQDSVKQTVSNALHGKLEVIQKYPFNVVTKHGPRTIFPNIQFRPGGKDFLATIVKIIGSRISKEHINVTAYRLRPKLNKLVRFGEKTQIVGTYPPLNFAKFPLTKEDADDNLDISAINLNEILEAIANSDKTPYKNIVIASCLRPSDDAAAKFVHTGKFEHSWSGKLPDSVGYKSPYAKELQLKLAKKRTPLGKQEVIRKARKKALLRGKRVLHKLQKDSEKQGKQWDFKNAVESSSTWGSDMFIFMQNDSPAPPDSPYLSPMSEVDSPMSEFVETPDDSTVHLAVSGHDSDLLFPIDPYGAHVESDSGSDFSPK